MWNNKEASNVLCIDGILNKNSYLKLNGKVMTIIAIALRGNKETVDLI